MVASKSTLYLRPKPFNKHFLEKFIRKAKEAQIREALSRLHIKVFGTDDDSLESYFSHSTAIVSTAGAMIGSYNYTAKARIRHFEHAVLLEANCEATDLLRDELRSGWDAIESKEMTFPAPKPEARKREASSTGGSGVVANPYAKKPKGRDTSNP